MKDYIKVANRLTKMFRCSITQCGTPTQDNPVNLHVNINEPYIIGYSMYICYNCGKWSIDYSRYPCDNIRVNMNHIKNIRTDKEMFDTVRQIVHKLRQKQTAPNIPVMKEPELNIDR